MQLDKDLTTIGIDMGGTKIAVGIFRNEELLEDEILVEATPQTGADDILAEITNMVNKLKDRHPVTAIGMSTAGMVNDKGEMIGACGNIKYWKGTKVKKELEARTQLPTAVENDANCAAFGEYMVGCARDYDPVLLVILGTGIGGGFVWDHRIMRGAHFGGGEIGHIKVSDSKTHKCTCGAWDCWEAYGSGTGLENIARLSFADPRMDNYKLVELHKKGDENAIQVFGTWHEYLALGMSSMINTFDPDAVVVSGGMAKFVNYSELNRLTKEKVVDGLKNYVNIIEGILGNNSGMIGAACLANILATSLQRN
jgi:glucokinase